MVSVSAAKLPPVPLTNCSPSSPPPLPPLQGFALFATSAHARQMVELLSGMQFDDESTLRAEMAHKNMFLKVRGNTLGWAGLGPLG